MAGVIYSSQTTGMQEGDFSYKTLTEFFSPEYQPHGKKSDYDITADLGKRVTITISIER